MKRSYQLEKKRFRGYWFIQSVLQICMGHNWEGLKLGLTSNLREIMTLINSDIIKEREEELRTGLQYTTVKF